MKHVLPPAVSALVFLLVAAPVAQAQTDPHREGVLRCLANWKGHPFDASSPEYRLIEPRVSIFGIGGGIEDDVATSTPELVYIRPNVSVMSKSVIELLNPNGWYCLEQSVSVMAKTEIRMHCKAKLASTKEGVSVMGGGDRGVNVMGATQVETVGCE